MSGTNPEAGLVRAIGPWALGANAINLTVGAGIFALPALVAAILGPAAVLAYLVCGALILLVLTCFVEIGTVVTRSGGAVAYIEEAFGPMAGFVAWVVFAVAYAAGADAAVAHVVLDATAASAPVLAGGLPRALALVLLFGGLAAINVRGVRQGTRLAVAATVAKLVPLLLLVALGLFAIQWSAVSVPAWPSLEQLGAGGAGALLRVRRGGERPHARAGRSATPLARCRAGFWAARPACCSCISRCSSWRSRCWAPNWRRAAGPRSPTWRSGWPAARGEAWYSPPPRSPASDCSQRT